MNSFADCYAYAYVSHPQIHHMPFLCILNFFINIAHINDFYGQKIGRPYSLVSIRDNDNEIDKKARVSPQNS